MSTNSGRVNRRFSENELQDMAAALDLLDQSIPFFRGLSPRDQRRLVRIGTSNQEFVHTIKLAVDNVDVLPGYISMMEFQNEYAIYFQLEALIATVKGLEEKLKHTQLAAGNHLMNDCLDVYKTMAAAVDRGVAEVAPYYEEAQKRFESQGRGSSDQENDPFDPTSDEPTALPATDLSMSQVNTAGAGGNILGSAAGSLDPGDAPVNSPA